MNARSPLPQGLSPVSAGRWGLWLLGLRNHRAASQRCGLVHHVYNRSLADRFRGLITPWRIYEYGGTLRLMAQICRVSEDSARQWCTGGQKLPAHQCRRLAGYLHGHAASALALAEELEETAERRSASERCFLAGAAAGTSRFGRALKAPGMGSPPRSD